MDLPVVVNFTLQYRKFLRGNNLNCISHTVPLYHSQRKDFSTASKQVVIHNNGNKDS